MQMLGPSGRKTLMCICMDWLLIAVAIVLSSYSTYLIPVSLLLIGSRQRALSNLTHDASHVNLLKNKKLNDFLANICCALAMFETVSFYRSSHVKHHQFLGDSQKDPDSASHLASGYEDQNPWTSNPWSGFSRLIFNLSSWKSSVVGNLTSLRQKDMVMVLSWWMVIMSVSLKISWLIPALWFASKLTTYHLIRVVAEYLDHTGLKGESVLTSTRNLPHRGLIPLIFHPHDDTYHIVHHLHPNIPHYHLAFAHQILMQQKVYRFAHHCDSYVFGKHSAASCWVGKCEIV